MQLENASDIAQLQQIVGENRCVLIDVGMTQAVHTLDLSTKPAVIKALSLHHIVQAKAVLDQFQKGLDSLRVLDCVRQKPDLMKGYFVAASVPLTAGKHN